MLATQAVVSEMDDALVLQSYVRILSTTLLLIKIQNLIRHKIVKRFKQIEIMEVPVV